MGINTSLNYNEIETIFTILHELTHCLSSGNLLQIFNKAKIGVEAAWTGFNKIFHETVDDTFFYFYNNLNLYTEGVTEFLTQCTRKRCGLADNHLGAYFSGRKNLAQLYMLLGKDIIKAYFENDTKVFDQLFAYEKPVEKFLIDETGIDKDCFYKAADHVHNAAGYSNTDMVKHFNLANTNLALLNKKICNDLYRHRDNFRDGVEIKQSIINTFLLYSRNLFFGFKTDKKLIYDYWTTFANILDQTLQFAEIYFEKTKGIMMPLTQEEEILDIVKSAQKICRFCYFAKPISEYIHITKAHESKIQKIAKTLPNAGKNVDRVTRCIGADICCDISRDYFDPQEFMGESDVYDKSTMEQVEQLLQYDDEKEYDDDVEVDYDLMYPLTGNELSKEKKIFDTYIL